MKFISTRVPQSADSWQRKNTPAELTFTVRPCRHSPSPETRKRSGILMGKRCDRRELHTLVIKINFSFIRL
jgi:hypothetical protein